jgi:homoserine O-acetyltransferase/O-succinyltransferase
VSNTFTLPNFSLQCGAILSTAELVYQTYGELNADRQNVILYPTSYGAQHSDIDWLVRPGGILDTNRWFVIIPNMFGNGLSSSPSNCPDCGLAEQNFWFTHWDNVRAQAALLDHLGIEHLAMVYGWSMGAQQAYYWGVMYPDRVARIAVLCGTATTTPHNQIFLASLRSALTADPAWDGEKFLGMPDRGFHTFARIYASWAASQAFYREQLYVPLGYESLEDYLVRGWEASYRQRDPRNLMAMIDTWMRCDVGGIPGGARSPLTHPLTTIRAKTLVMASATDLYFTPADCQREAAQIPGAVYREIPSIWGHRAGNPAQSPADAEWIRAAVWMLHTHNS